MNDYEVISMKNDIYLNTLMLESTDVLDLVLYENKKSSILTSDEYDKLNRMERKLHDKLEKIDHDIKKLDTYDHDPTTKRKFFSVLSNVGICIGIMNMFNTLVSNTISRRIRYNSETRANKETLRMAVRNADYTQTDIDKMDAKYLRETNTKVSIAHVISFAIAAKVVSICMKFCSSAKDVEYWSDGDFKRMASAITKSLENIRRTILKLNIRGDEKNKTYLKLLKKCDENIENCKKMLKDAEAKRTKLNDNKTIL